MNLGRPYQSSPGSLQAPPCTHLAYGSEGVGPHVLGCCFPGAPHRELKLGAGVCEGLRGGGRPGQGAGRSGATELGWMVCSQDPELVGHRVEEADRARTPCALLQNGRFGAGTPGNAMDSTEQEKPVGMAPGKRGFWLSALPPVLSPAHHTPSLPLGPPYCRRP